MGKLVDFAYNIFFSKKEQELKAKKAENVDSPEKTTEDNLTSKGPNRMFSKKIKAMADGAKKDESNNFIKSNLPVSFVIDSLNAARFYGFIDEFNENGSNYPVQIEDDGEHQYLYCTPSAFKRILHLYYTQFSDTPIKLKGIYHGEPIKGKKIDINEEPFYAQFFEDTEENVLEDVEEDFEQDL